MGKTHKARFAALVLVTCGTLVANSNVASSKLQAADYVVGLGYSAPVVVYRQNPYAEYLKAVGDLQLKQAKAAEHMENARSHALDNDVKEVESYYEARLKNREYRRVLNPSQSVREMRQKMLMEYRVTQLTQATLSQEDLASEMNWLAGEVYRLRLADKENGQPTVLGQAAAPDLSPSHLVHVRLTDQPGRNKEGLIWRASDAVVLDVRWPYLFLSPEFDQARREFESQRALALEDIHTTGRVLFPQQYGLRLSQGYLAAQFNELCTRRLNIPYAVDEDEFKRGQDFLRSLDSQVNRLMHAEDAQAYDGRYAFEGNSMCEMVDHLGRHGLGFASPQDGDEGTYRYVFQQLVDLYQQYKGHAGPQMIVDPTAPAPAQPIQRIAQNP